MKIFNGYKKTGNKVYKWDDEWILTGLKEIPSDNSISIQDFTARVLELDKKRKASIPEIVKPIKVKKQYKRKSSAKPREEWLTKKGTELPQAILDEDLVRYIRKSVAFKESSMKEIANTLGVHYRTIQKVVYMQTWGWVR